MAHRQMLTSSLLRISNFGRSLENIGIINTISRTFGSRKDCSEEVGPRCTPENLAKTKCAEEKPKRIIPTYSNFYYKPECCLDPCADAYPRFDDLYYVPSDKANRCYNVTWNECPEQRIVPKVVCCNANVIRPAFKPRPKTQRPTTCTRLKCDVGDKCPKMALPGCQRPRSPPKCKKYVKLGVCKKVCAPYPSFSECTRPPLRKPPPSECQCLEYPMMCETWEYWRKHQILNSNQCPK